MSAADLINIIRKEASKTLKNEFYGFELATVTSPYPNLVIRIDNMKVELGSRDLMICEHLTKNSKIISLKSTPKTKRKLGDSEEEDKNTISKSTGNIIASTDIVNDHSHTIEEFSLLDADIELSYVELKFEEVLKAGDRVLVQAIPGGQKYIIIDRVVEYV